MSDRTVLYTEVPFCGVASQVTTMPIPLNNCLFYRRSLWQPGTRSVFNVCESIKRCFPQFPVSHRMGQNFMSGRLNGQCFLNLLFVDWNSNWSSALSWLYCALVQIYHPFSHPLWYIRIFFSILLSYQKVSQLNLELLDNNGNAQYNTILSYEDPK